MPNSGVGTKYGMHARLRPQFGDGDPIATTA
jgi:hypothetical protein